MSSSVIKRTAVLNAFEKQLDTSSKRMVERLRCFSVCPLFVLASILFLPAIFCGLLVAIPALLVFNIAKILDSSLCSLVNKCSRKHYIRLYRMREKFLH